MGSSQDSSFSYGIEEKDDRSDDDGDQTRLPQQLQHLRSLLPYKTEADEISILEGARDFLERIQEETAQIEEEMSRRSENPPNQRPQLLQVETEELTEETFVVKFSWRKECGVAGRLQRLLEALDVEITAVDIVKNGPHGMLSTAFVKVKKEMRMTNEKLQNLIISAAKTSGLIP